MDILQLGKNHTITVSENHTFGTDAVLLSDFAISRKVKKACDLGTGCGIIPLLWLKNKKCETAVGVEIQDEAVSLCENTISRNNLGNTFSVVHSDLCEIKGKLPFGEFDVVSCNPPYKAPGAGIKNPADAKKIARHETLCTFDDICFCASKLLKFGGKFCVCHRPERLSDIITAMKQCKIEPKRLRTVSQRVGESPWLVLVEGRFGGKSGMVIEPPLFVETNGELSDEMMKIYGDFKEGKGRKI